MIGLTIQNSILNPIKDFKKLYLTIEALEDGLQAKLSGTELEYSTDGTNWSILPIDTFTPEVNTGQYIYFRGNTIGISGTFGTFTVTKKFNICGPMASLFKKNAGPAKGCISAYQTRKTFNYLFKNCTTLISAKDLIIPYEVSCERMFQGCTSLEIPPKNIITRSSLFYMFDNCTALKELPARYPSYSYEVEDGRALFNGCTGLSEIYPYMEYINYDYGGMSSAFSNCTGLKKVYLPLEPQDIKKLFNNVTNCTLSKLPKDDWDPSYIPEGWTVEDNPLFLPKASSVVFDGNSYIATDILIHDPFQTDVEITFKNTNLTLNDYRYVFGCSDGNIEYSLLNYYTGSNNIAGVGYVPFKYNNYINTYNWDPSFNGSNYYDFNNFHEWGYDYDNISIGNVAFSYGGSASNKKPLLPIMFTIGALGIFSNEGATYDTSKCFIGEISKIVIYSGDNIYILLPFEGGFADFLTGKKYYLTKVEN